MHFQLRNLVWATSKHDVYVAHNNCVHHWSPVTQRASEVRAQSRAQLCG